MRFSNMLPILVFLFDLLAFPSRCALQAETPPPKEIPAELYHDFTLNNQIPVVYCYRNDVDPLDQPRIYTPAQIQSYISKARAKKTLYYGQTDTYLYNALDKYCSYVAGKSVAVIGSTIPWYESILFAYGARPTTIEYNKIVSDDPRLEVLTVREFDANPRQFDAVVSISSFEHDGLGRYGDPVNPQGDLEAMEKARKMLKPGGLLFLAVPVGKDCLVWNLHRVYGKLRLKMLLKGWRIIEYFGFTSQDLEYNAWQSVKQPVFVLQPIPRR